MIRGSTESSEDSLMAGGSAIVPGSGTDTSRRRHREKLVFSAVRATHALGAGCLLTGGVPLARLLPVWFTVDYRSAGEPAAVRLPGFPDLSQVPYSGCTEG
jgi:hypothetical protein